MTPDAIMDGARRGSFLMSLMRNELVQSYQHADDENRAALEDWVRWLYNEVPGNAWGSAAAVQAWMEKGGLRGMVAQ